MVSVAVGSSDPCQARNLERLALAHQDGVLLQELPRLSPAPGGGPLHPALLAHEPRACPAAWRHGGDLPRPRGARQAVRPADLEPISLEAQQKNTKAIVIASV